MTARKTRLVAAPMGGVRQTSQHSTMTLMSGSMGASPIIGQSAPLENVVQEQFESSVDDSAYSAMVRQREMAEGLRDAVEAAIFVPQRTPERYDGILTNEALSEHLKYTPLPAHDTLAHMPPVRLGPPNLDGLPQKFSLEIEMKPDGTWKITAPAVHVGLFVADRDLPAALAKAPSVLAEIVRLDGVVAGPKKRGKRA